MDPFDSLRRVLNGKAISAANAAGLAGKLELPNTNFVKPPKKEMYASFWYKTGGSRQAELGGRRGFELTVGIYQFDIYVPEHTGDGPGMRAGDYLRARFNRREWPIEPDGYLKMLVSNVKTPFNGAQAGYWRVVVDGSFHYYHRDPDADGFRD